MLAPLRSGDTAGLALPSTIAVDLEGSLYVAEEGGHVIRRLQDGLLETLAGTGAPLFYGDGGAATTAGVPTPLGISVDGLGRVAVADATHHRVRLIEPTGEIRTVAGRGPQANPALNDGFAAGFADLINPYATAFDGIGRLYIADVGHRRVRRIGTDGIIQTILGNGTCASLGDGGAATAASLCTPAGLAVDSARQRIFVADYSYGVIRMISPDGIATTVAGTGVNASGPEDGVAVAVPLNRPRGLAVGPNGHLYIAEYQSHRVRKLDLDTGQLTTVAGNGEAAYPVEGADARLTPEAYPTGVAVDRSGTLYLVSGVLRRVYRVNAAGAIETVVGNGINGDIGPGSYAREVALYGPRDVDFDPEGRLVFGDPDNARVLRIDHDGTLSVLAGTGRRGHDGDGGPATAASFAEVTSISVDETGQVYVTDARAHRIRRIDLSGVIDTVVGTGTAGFNGDGILATQAQLYDPRGAFTDETGHLYVVDRMNQRIRRVDLQTGLITTVAGTGVAGYNGDGIPAVEAMVQMPTALRARPDGSFVFTDAGNHRIREVGGLGDDEGVIRTLAGNGNFPTTCDAALDVGSPLANPSSLDFDPRTGEVVFANQGCRSLWRIHEDGTLGLVAGNRFSGFTGDGGPAVQARLQAPRGLRFAADGTLVFHDHAFDLVNGQAVNRPSRLRQVDPSGRISTVAGLIQVPLLGPLGYGRLLDARQATALGSGRYAVACGRTGRVVLADLAAGLVEEVLGYDAASQPSGGSLARFAVLGEPAGIVRAPTGRLYMTDRLGARLLAIDLIGASVDDWTYEVLIDEGLVSPRGLAWDLADDTLLIADAGAHCIQRYAPDTGELSSAVGSCGAFGRSGDGTSPEGARLWGPEQVLVDEAGAVYVSDTLNHRVLVVRQHHVHTLLGNGAPADNGDGVPARTYPVASPRGLAIDERGNVFVASPRAVRLVADLNDDGQAEGDELALRVSAASTDTNLSARCLSVVVTTPDGVTAIDGCTGSAVAYHDHVVWP